MKLGIDNNRKIGKFTNMWKRSHTLLDNASKKKSKGNKKIFGNENTTY